MSRTLTQHSDPWTEVERDRQGGVSGQDGQNHEVRYHQPESCVVTRVGHVVSAASTWTGAAYTWIPHVREYHAGYSHEVGLPRRKGKPEVCVTVTGYSCDGTFLWLDIPVMGHCCDGTFLGDFWDVQQGIPRPRGIPGE
jgi:hypothetical protein